MAVLLFTYFLFFLSLWICPDQVWFFTKITLLITVVTLTILSLRKYKFKKLVRRFFDSVFTVFIVAVLCFILIRILPGTPLAAEELSPEVSNQLTQQYNLDSPIVLQLKDNIVSFFKGEFGSSIVTGRKISYTLSYYLPRSIQLGFIALVFCIALSVLFLLIKVFFIKTNSKLESVFTFIISSQMAMPSFLAAAVLSYLMAYKYSLLPMGLWLGPIHYFLPALCLSIRPASILSQLLIDAVESELSQNYVQSLKAKGVSRTKVIFKHIFPTASLSALGFVGPLASSLLTGSFVIEYMFAIPGVGSLMVDSVLNRDYPVVVIMTIVFCVLLQFFNFISDALSEFLNPQVEAL